MYKDYKVWKLNKMYKIAKWKVLLFLQTNLYLAKYTRAIPSTKLEFKYQKK